MGIDLYCNQCGESLDVEVDSRLKEVRVEPCSKCLDAAKDGGYDDGYKAGKEDVE